MGLKNVQNKHVRSIMQCLFTRLYRYLSKCIVTYWINTILHTYHESSYCKKQQIRPPFCVICLCHGSFHEFLLPRLFHAYSYIHIRHILQFLVAIWSMKFCFLPLTFITCFENSGKLLISIINSNKYYNSYTMQSLKCGNVVNVCDE